MVACGQLLREVRDGLGGRYFRDRICDPERDAIPAMLATLAVIAPDPADPPRILRDASDDYLVALARAADAEAIVTGDRDLLDHEGLSPPALSARQACLRLGLIAE
jgi:predicted nucleic acid-binding protein